MRNNTTILTNILNKVDSESRPYQLQLEINCFIDWLTNVALGISNKNYKKIVAASGFDKYNGQLTDLLSDSHLCTPALRALLLGTAAHFEDFDDVNIPAQSHLTAVIMSAVMAVGVKHDLEFAPCFSAFSVGYEYAAQFAVVNANNVSGLGYHPTSIFGGIGAAVATSQLMNLSPKEILSAISLAATRVSGLRAAFGTMIKPLHVGWAARIGVESALLARSGIETNHDLWCGQGGKLMTLGLSPTAKILDRKQVGWISQNTFKIYASCFGTQAAAVCAEAAKERAEDHGWNILHMCLNVGADNERICSIEDPKTAEELKFSIKGIVAMIISGHNPKNPLLITQHNFNDMSYRKSLKLISINYDKSLNFAQARLQATTKKGGAINIIEDLRGEQKQEVQRKNLIKRIQSVIGDQFMYEVSDLLASLEDESRMTIRDGIDKIRDIR
ncbi:MAG: MmgE/PrpD family protein [Candidatus Cloacimonetes bacterium]|nr:MmgE/PrpD family protein [Candidatus Cloacimonadota bacterium]